MTGLGSSCGACKFLRRKCTSECVFAPYFCYDQAADHFAAVHKVFGASNVSKQLLHLPLQNRSHAAITISFQALARLCDPIYGCVSHIFALQQQVTNLQEQIELLGSQMNNFAFRVSGGGTNLRSEFDMNMQPAFARNRTGNVAVNSSTYEILSPLCEYQNSYLSPLETLLEGVDQEIMAHSLWMDNGIHATN